MILYTKQDDRAALPAPVEGNPQLYKNIKLDGSNLICIAGRPGMGKTSFALHLAQEYAKNSSKAVYIFTLELLSNHVYDRLLISGSEVDSYTYREKLFSATEAERVEQAKIKLSNMNLIIDDDTISLTVSQIEERLENHDNIGMIVIDYFQLLLPDQRTIDREQECCEIARKLKEISRRVGIPIIFTSHLPRSVEYRKDKRPLLIDLKGAGVPEQYVDTACLIYREGYYDIDSENDAADIIVAKNQYGSCDVLSFEWQGKFMKYIEKNT